MGCSSSNTRDTLARKVKMLNNYPERDKNLQQYIDLNEKLNKFESESGINIELYSLKNMIETNSKLLTQHSITGEELKKYAEYKLARKHYKDSGIFKKWKIKNYIEMVTKTTSEIEHESLDTLQDNFKEFLVNLKEIKDEQLGVPISLKNVDNWDETFHVLKYDEEFKNIEVLSISLDSEYLNQQVCNHISELIDHSKKLLTVLIMLNENKKFPVKADLLSPIFKAIGCSPTIQIFAISSMDNHHDLSDETQKLIVEMLDNKNIQLFAIGKLSLKLEYFTEIMKKVQLLKGLLIETENVNDQMVEVFLSNLNTVQAAFLYGYKDNSMMNNALKSRKKNSKNKILVIGPSPKKLKLN